MSAASPPELPPHVRADEYGFDVVPKMGLEHSNASRVWGMPVLQIGMPPCERKIFTSWARQ
jgi:hypothetical protein